MEMDYKLLMNLIADYPAITIISKSGNPPDHYEIEYKLRGFELNDDGNITVALSHRVEISIPFGYPHFPPKVKPLSKIFHPDVDSTAFLIADHWEKNPDLSQLVITIGNMICGKVYSKEEEFSQKAAAWYAKNKGILPLDTIQFVDHRKEKATTGNREDELELLAPDNTDENRSETKLTDNSSLNLEVEKESDQDAQLALLKTHLEQKELFAASELLAKIPTSALPDNHQQLSEKIDKNIKICQKKLKQAEELAESEEYDEAQVIVDKITTIAADTPGLWQLSQQLKESPVLSSTDGNKNKEVKKETPAPEERKEKKWARREKEEGQGSLIDKKIVLTVMVVLLLIPVGIGVMIYLQDKKIISQGEARLSKVEQLIQKKQFFAAQTEADSLTRSLNEITLLSSSGNKLEQKVNTILSSQEFKQGLQGKVLYQGEYVPVDSVKKLTELSALLEKAQAKENEKQTEESIEAYKTALAYAKANHLPEKELEITQKINNLDFTRAMAIASQAEENKDWANAIATYNKAIELSKNVSDAKGNEEISKKLTSAVIRSGLDNSKKSFSDSDWPRTIASLEQVKEIVDKNPDSVSQQEKRTLNGLLANARLFNLLAQAKTAYENGSWSDSITKYEQAIAFIKENQNDLIDNKQASIKDISRTILMMKIGQAHEEAIAAEKNKKTKPIIAAYKKVTDLIDTATAQYGDDENLLEMKRKIVQKRAKLQENSYLQSKISWLHRNYKSIFKKHYPSYNNFTNLRVNYMGTKGPLMIFSMSCKKAGSSARLALKYAYNKRTNQWQVYKD